MGRQLMRRAAAVALVGVVLTACGVQTQDRPQRINRNDVPFRLLDPSKNTSSPTTRP